MKKFLTKGAVLAMALATMATAQQKKFDTYGFLDASLSKMFIEEDNFLLQSGFDDALRFRVGNINLYNDFKPNNNIRVLIETGLHWQPHGNYQPEVVRVVTNAPLPDSVLDTAYIESNTVNPQGKAPVPAWQISVPRAWFEYSFSQYSKVKIGKFLTPVGIWNVDHGSPVIVTASQPYSTGLAPLFPQEQMGIMNSGTKYLGDFDLDYKAYLSTGRSVQTITEPKDISVGANVKFKATDWADGFEFGLSGYTGLEKVEARTTYVSASYVPGGIVPGIPNDTILTDFKSITHEVENTVETRENFVGLDAKFNLKGLLVQSEFNYNYLKDYVNSTTSNNIGWYGLTGYKFRVNPKLSVMPYFFYEGITGEYNNVIPTLSDGVEKINTLATGLNLTVFTNSSIKLEYRYLDIDLDDNTEEYINDAFDFGIFTVQFAVAF